MVFLREAHPFLIKGVLFSFLNVFECGWQGEITQVN